ncbi:hypothetical protein V6N13_086790 [Hibiscus sabdariffa]|uniref:Uncharacterized protein n=1 Tax=Hibiscus sabdariffa TaxID=183260 RepID=A0ABR2FV19_9ROSI
MAEKAMEKPFSSSTLPQNGGLENTPPLKDQKLDENPHDSAKHLPKTYMETVEKPLNSLTQPENGGLENTPPLQDQKLDENPQDSGKYLRKTSTPDRLKVPKAFKYPERYTSPTDSMMSPVTKGLLARNRKAGGSLLLPSINQTRKMETDHRVQVTPLSRQESSVSSSSNQNLGKSEFIEPLTPLNVPSETSNEQSSDDNIPNRIPSAIFSSKPETPNEWSITSNESLFSIHIGSNSCSKEQFLSLYKSGELTKLDEQIIAQGGVMPSLKELEEMAVMEESFGKDYSGAKETLTPGVRTSEAAEYDGHNKDGIEDHRHEKKLPAEVHNLRRSRVSGVSDESTLSFAFPVLNGTEGGGRLSSVKIGLCNQESKTRSVKPPQEPEPEQCTEESKPETPENATSRSWFSCFGCCR